MRILILVALLGGTIGFVPTSNAMCAWLLKGKSSSLYASALKEKRRYRQFTITFHNGKQNGEITTIHDVELLQKDIFWDGETGNEFRDKWTSTVKGADGSVSTSSGENTYLQQYERGEIFFVNKINGKYEGHWSLGGSEPSVSDEFYDVVSTLWRWSKVSNYTIPARPGSRTEQIDGYRLNLVRANGPRLGSYSVYNRDRGLIYMENRWDNELNSQTWLEDI